MAYLKIIPIKSTVKTAVNYITNPDKTEEQQLVSSYGCSPETAELEFAMTRDAAKKMVYDRDDDVLARHLIISFKPGEIKDPETAHEVGKRIADEILKGKYEYVISTHVDKKHYHCHVIFNNIGFTDYHRFRSNKRTYHKMCMLSNRICREYGLSENMPSGEKGKSYKENMEYQKGNSWKAKLKYAVDRAIWSSVTFDEFIEKMKKSGYEVRQGKYLAFRAPEQKHFTNVKTLGAYYTEENIFKRLEQGRNQVKLPRHTDRKVRMFIEMTAYVSEHNRPGFDRWAARNNLKEAAKTFNYLSAHNLLNYDEFQNHIRDIDASVLASDHELQKAQNKLQEHKLIQKNCEIYRACRNIILAEKSSPDRKLYRSQHKEEYQLHDSILKQLEESGITKLPSPEKLQRQAMELEEELAALNKEKQELLKQQKELRNIENNFFVMLHDAGIEVPEKEKSHNHQEETL